MPGVLKNYRQSNQVTAEKFGKAARTETSDDYNELLTMTEIRVSLSDDFYDDLQDYVKVLGPKKDLLPIEGLGVSSLRLGQSLERNAETPDYGASLVRFGQTHSAIADAQKEYSRALKEGLHASMYRFHNEARELEKLKKKLESRRLDYDAKCVLFLFYLVHLVHYLSRLDRIHITDLENPTAPMRRL